MPFLPYKRLEKEEDPDDDSWVHQMRGNAQSESGGLDRKREHSGDVDSDSDTDRKRAKKEKKKHKKEMKKEKKREKKEKKKSKREKERR